MNRPACLLLTVVLVCHAGDACAWEAACYEGADECTEFISFARPSRRWIAPAGTPDDEHLQIWNRTLEQLGLDDLRQDFRVTVFGGSQLGDCDLDTKTCVVEFSEKISGGFRSVPLVLPAT